VRVKWPRCEANKFISIWVPELRISGAIPPLFLYILMAYRDDFAIFTLHCLLLIIPATFLYSNRNEYQEHFLGVKAAGA
jgi:hypothetical protein